MSTFTANKLGTVFTIEAEVIDRALHSPHNSFTNTNDEYQVTVELPVTELINEFESIFRIHAHPSLPHENVWKQGEYRIRINTLVSPRMDSVTRAKIQACEMIFSLASLTCLWVSEKAIERLLLGVTTPLRRCWTDKRYRHLIMNINQKLKAQERLMDSALRLMAQAEKYQEQANKAASPYLQ